MTTRSLACSVIAIVVLIARPLTQQPAAGRLADVRVPGPANAASLALPATPYSAFNAFIRVLEAVKMRYGAEGPASDPAKPPIDLGRDYERAVELAGRPLHEALDAIVQAAPAFRWSDSGDTIVVRASGDGVGILDHRLANFSVTDATPRQALEAFVAVLDPSRAAGMGFQQTENGAPAMRKVSVSLRDVTVETALKTLAREFGTLSWTIKYDAAPASIATASITFTTPDGLCRAVSPAQLRRQALGSTAPWQLGISGAPLKDLLVTYAVRARVAISIEEVSTITSRTNVSAMVLGTPPLELPDDPAQAVARIVELDSRYEWSQQGGRFRVQPKTGRSTILDQTIPELAATDEPAASVFERVIGTIGSPRQLGDVIRREPDVIDAGLATRISVRRTGPVSIRDGLNAIADATGWTWTARPAPTTGQSNVMTIEWHGPPRPLTGRGTPVALSSNPSTWSVAFVISMAPVPAPARPMTVPIPGATPAPARPPMRPFIDVPVTGESLRRAISMMATNHDVLIGLEVVASSTPRSATTSRENRIDLGDMTVAEAFAKIRDSASDYTVALDKDVYHVRPREAQRDSTPWLNVEVAQFERRFEDMRDVLSAVARLDWPRNAPPANIAVPPSPGIDGMLKKTIDVSLRNVTIRDILDEVARRHGAMYWIVEQRVAVSGPLVRVTFASRDWSITTTVR